MRSVDHDCGKEGKGKNKKEEEKRGFLSDMISPDPLYRSSLQRTRRMRCRETILYRTAVCRRNQPKKNKTSTGDGVQPMPQWRVGNVLKQTSTCSATRGEPFWVETGLFGADGANAGTYTSVLAKKLHFDPTIYGEPLSATLLTPT